MPKHWYVFYRSTRWVATRPRCTLPKGKSVYWVLTANTAIRMDATRSRGVCATACIKRDMRLSGRADAVLWERGRPSMKKVKRADQAAVKHLAALESELFRDHMGIVEHLALLQYDDGSPRPGGRLIIDVRGAAWTVVCKDVDSGMQLVCIGSTLDAALDALQIHLGSEDAPWEPDPWAKNVGPRKGKKN